jgi:hypothetical protein
MALINCSECGHEVSTDAVACPNCGRPIAAPAPPPVVHRKVVVADATRDDGFPKWLIVPIVILGAIVVFLLVALMRNENDTADSRNINVNVAQRRASESRETSNSRVDTSPNEVSVPSSATTVSTPLASAPQTVPPAAQTEVATIPADRGSVTIDAKIATAAGAVQSVKNEKFYLLDEDLETILSDADLEPIEGQTLTNSFGLAVLYPDRYADFQRDALNAIKKHIKYSGTTDAAGKASMKDVKPDSYYLFGITKTRNGFAVWSSPVSITGGENKLNLSPARLNEMSE